MLYEDTISAVATALGEGGIGVIRVSGTGAIAIGTSLFRSSRGKKLAELRPYQAVHGHIIDFMGRIVDECLVLVMKAPNSYTREDVIEIQCHGGAASLRRILELTLEAGARLAEPGEFTKRAFLNGRLDLAQAEAVIDIIRAKTDSSLAMAVNHLSGALSGRIRDIQDEIIVMIAQLEAAIDFPEDDIEELTAQAVAERISQVLPKITHLLATAQTGKILRDGLATAIIGKPNVGKSSLLNALVREKRAIVTDIPGTTRDVIEEYINIKGIPLKIMDTAGIRMTEDVVERMGVDKARSLVETVDLVLLLLDSSQPLTDDDYEIIGMLANRPVIILINKSDLSPVFETEKVSSLCPGKPVIHISALCDTGLDDLGEYITQMVYTGEVTEGEQAYVATMRQSELLRKAKDSLESVISTVVAAMPIDCLVVDLRAAWEALGQITGDSVGSDILDEIFSRFCIGK